MNGVIQDDILFATTGMMKSSRPDLVSKTVTDRTHGSRVS